MNNSEPSKKDYIDALSQLNRVELKNICVIAMMIKNAKENDE